MSAAGGDKKVVVGQQGRASSSAMLDDSVAQMIDIRSSGAILRILVNMLEHKERNPHFDV